MRLNKTRDKRFHCLVRDRRSFPGDFRGQISRLIIVSDSAIQV